MPNPTAKSDEQDLLVVHNVLNENFTVQWGGQPFSVSAGEDKVYPRFIAEHMAKHMADRFLLLKEEDLQKASTSKLQYSLLNDKVERSKIVSEILPKVFQKYSDEPQVSEQDRLNTRIDEANRQFQGKPDLTDPNPIRENELVIKDTAPVANKALGNLEEHKEPPTSNAPKSAPAKTGGKPSKKQLVDEAKELGIKLTGNESADEILEKITSEYA